MGNVYRNVCILLAIVVTGSVASCWAFGFFDSPVPQEHVKSVVVIHRNSAGKSEKHVVDDAAVLADFNKWIEASPRGVISLTTYAPQTQLRTENFNVNVSANMLVFEWKVDPQKWRQTVRPINADDQRMIDQIVAAAEKVKPAE